MFAIEIIHFSAKNIHLLYFIHDCVFTIIIIHIMNFDLWRSFTEDHVLEPEI